MPADMVVIVLLGGIMMFVAWVLIPESEKKEGDKAAQIPNPIIRQGAILAVYLVHLFAGGAFVILMVTIILWILARM